MRIQPFLPLDQKDHMLGLKAKNTDFKIEIFDYQEQWISEINWLCQNTSALGYSID